LCRHNFVISLIHVLANFSSYNVSAMKTPDIKGTSNEEESIVTKLLQSVKDDYETRGSGTKPRPAGPSAKQIKAQALQEWASNPSTKTTQLEQQLETRRLRQGLTTLIDVNGTPAYTCWDTGAELDCISPDFTRAIGIRATPKKVALKIRLGAKGSTTMSTYEAKAQLDFGNVHLEHLVDVVNISRWDLIMGSPFCNKYKVILNYEDRTIRFGDTVITALPLEEEENLRRGDPSRRQQVRRS